MWTSIEWRDGRTFNLGDEVRVTLRDESVFEGHLNEIAQGYITLANTGHTPVPGFGTTLGFPTADIKDMEEVKRGRDSVS